VWGAEDGHRIDLWRDGEAIESIKVRIDARKPATKFIESVCAFAKSMQCRFYGYNAHAEIDSTPAALLAALRESDATKFVRDPRDFLSEIADRADP
jgi:hypothetical protein